MNSLPLQRTRRHRHRAAPGASAARSAACSPRTAQPSPSSASRGPGAHREAGVASQRRCVAASLLRDERRRLRALSGGRRRHVLREHGRIDFLVNNAGITRDHTVRKMTVEEWEAVLQVNLSGPFFMIKAVLDTMVDAGFRADRQHQLGGRARAATSARRTTPPPKRACIGLTKTVARRGRQEAASPSTRSRRASSTPT